MQNFSIKKDLNGFVDSLHRGEFNLSTEQQDELAQITAEIQGKKNSVRLRIFETRILESENSSLSPLFESYKARVEATLRKHATALHNTHQIELPDGVSLRPKQIRFMDKLKDYFDPAKGKRSGFVKYPTGMGKTILISIMIKSLIKHGGSKALVLSPRNIVNEQNEKKIKSFQNEDVTVEDVSNLNGGPQPDVTIATYNLAALESGRISQNSKLGDYDVIFLDECHRSFGPKALEFFIRRYPKAVLVGLSATPYIGATEDVTKLKSAFLYFEGEIDSISLKEACYDGDLAPIRAYRIDAKFAQSSTVVDVNDVKAKDNSFARTNIALDLAKNRIPAGEKAIVFCTGIDHARHTALELQKAGFSAESVDSKMDKKDIDLILENYKAGKIQYIVNSDMLTEGFDDEETMHAIMLRPTRSAWMYEQMIGRAGRLDPNNPQKIATIWDVVGQHSDQCTVHGLAKFYGDIRDAFLNGSVIFGPEKLTNPKTLGVPKVTIQNNDLYVIDSDILVENIAKIQVPRDKSYYENPEYVKADLEAFAKAAGKTSIALSTGDAEAETICSNGESVTFRTYISNACVALGLANDSTDAKSKVVDTLKYLKKLAGMDVKDDRDEVYYKDPVKVKADLEAFAKACNKSVVELCTNDANTRTICSNGESVRFDTYITNACVALGIGEDSIDSKSRVLDALKYLKKLAGFDVKEYDDRDEIYYKDPVKVKADLEAFAKACGKNIFELSTKAAATEVVCSNGESVKFATYINNGGVALNLAKNAKDAMNKAAEILYALKKLAGVKYRDEIYYKDPVKVKADLETFAKAWGKNVTLLRMGCTNVEVICANGESVKFRTYICNACVALGITTDSDPANPILADTLKNLKKLAGFDVKEYDERDEAYYKDPVKVNADLEAFAKACGKSVLLLSTMDIGSDAICANGETVKFGRYITNAGVALGIANDAYEAQMNQKSILQLLKEIASKVRGL